LEHATGVLATLPSPDSTWLRTLSGPLYPLALLRATADTVPAQAYDRFLDETELAPTGWGDFVLALNSPVSYFVLLRKYGHGADIASYRSWMTSIGGPTVPAVSAYIAPREGRLGELQDAHWYRNGHAITPVMAGKTARDADLYVFAPEIFAPDSTGVTPSIIVDIHAMKHADGQNVQELPPEMVARIWNDFGPYFGKVLHDRAFRAADPRHFRSFRDQVCTQLHCPPLSQPACLKNAAGGCR
jgi:hypothetical protein